MGFVRYLTAARAPRGDAGSTPGGTAMRSPVRELEARFTQAKSAGECLAALLDLASLHAAEFRNLEGLRSARQALNIARARRDTVAVGRALAAATLCHYQRGDY